MYFNNMKYISRFLFMQAFFPFFVEENLIFVFGKLVGECFGFVFGFCGGLGWFFLFFKRLGWLFC